ncbi:nucleotidyltransferase family protein [Rhizobium sp. CF142]|uniref:nucleotidyltransferase family protein n=1 Tax=Rhizobium sp. CF142 TaxID=1144314 RepID=UPI00026EF7EF|nr:nucleotidyltransferase family protein [Rhizobium sp. CF142]EJJ28823.1 putative MobA-like protein [Rhizobium sp. CF142]
MEIGEAENGKPATADVETTLPVAEPRTWSRVAVVLLAAGASSRLGSEGHHKLLATFDGVPLVRRIAERAVSSIADTVVVVTGARSEDVAVAIDGLDLRLVVNAEYRSGMASSLGAGLRALAITEYVGVLVLLADMPKIETDHINRLIAAFRASPVPSVVRSVHNAQPGNPVILPRALFERVGTLEGDVGARRLIETSGWPIIDVELGEAATIDVDTQEDLLAAGGRLHH